MAKNEIAPDSREFLNEYFGKKEQEPEKRTIIFLALTQKAFRDLSDEMRLRRVSDSDNILTNADKVFVTPEDNIVVYKSIATGFRNSMSLPLTVSAFVSSVLTNPDTYYYMTKMIDGTTLSKGNLTDSGIRHTNTAMVMPNVVEIDPERACRVIQEEINKSTVYFDYETDYGEEVRLVENEHVVNTASLVVDDDIDEVSIHLSVEDAIYIRDGLNRFIEAKSKTL